MEKTFLNNKYKLKFRYGLTLEQFQEIANSQMGRCAICNSKKKLNVDHCHVKKNVRGLLCHHCNLALGHFKDNIKFLAKAIQYLTRNLDEGREA